MHNETYLVIIGFLLVSINSPLIANETCNQIGPIMFPDKLGKRYTEA